MNNRFDFSEFINSIIDKSYREILSTTDHEVLLVEKISFGVRGCVANRQAGSVQYIEQLKKFLFFMRQGMIPQGAEPHLWQYKRIAEKLVEKGEFKPSILNLFR